MTKPRVADIAIENPPSLLSRLLHWTVALLVIFQGLLGYANLHVGWFVSRRGFTIGLHEELGVLIALFTLAMLGLRVLEGRRSGHGLAPAQARLAAWMHAALYFLILAECALGVWIVGMLGTGLTFFFWHIPLPVRPDPQAVFEGGWMQVHAAIAAALASAAVLHALAALHHHYVLGDDVLRRMLPWRRRPRRAMAAHR